MRQHFTIGCKNRRRTSGRRHVFVADHVHRRSGVWNNFSVLWFED